MSKASEGEAQKEVLQGEEEKSHGNTWDDSVTYDADSESDDERANIYLMANVTEDSEASGSDSESNT